MNADEYQRRSMHTANYAGTERERLTNIALGLAGEAGELCEHIKKYVFHKHGLDKAELVYEAGDLLYYIAWLCDTIGTDLGVVMEMNIEKLQRRYGPDGFSHERSRERQI